MMKIKILLLLSGRFVPLTSFLQYARPRRLAHITLCLPGALGGMKMASKLLEEKKHKNLPGEVTSLIENSISPSGRPAYKCNRGPLPGE